MISLGKSVIVFLFYPTGETKDTQLCTHVRFCGKLARAKLNGSISKPVYLYQRENGANTESKPE